MTRTLYLILCLACLCWQCKETKELVPQTGLQNKINVLEFSIPGVDPKNISIGKDVIVIQLPANYPSEDFIKPSVILENGYASNSEILRGFHYEDQEVSLLLESPTKGNRSFKIIVVPYKAIQLTEPPKNLQLIIEPETQISAGFELKGTKATVFEGETLAYKPKIRLTNKATGEIAFELYQSLDVSEVENKITASLPMSMVPGDYTAELVWGPKAELLSSQVTIRSGDVFFRRNSWRMLETDRNFEVNGYNFSRTAKYEAIIHNDFTSSERIPLMFVQPGWLSGNLPESIGLGNYKITFLENGKEKKPYYEKQWALVHPGNDHFFIRKTTTQPIAKVVTQRSYLSEFETSMGYKLNYFPSVKEINRKESMLVYSETWGPFPNKVELILTDHKSRKEYIVPYSGGDYGLFDGFMPFMAFTITNAIPDGQYEVNVQRGSEKTERYSEIITIK